MSVAMFMRAIFVCLQDIQKLSKIDSISKDTSYWPFLMSLQCCTQLFAVFALFYSIYLVYKVEIAVATSPEAR